MTAPVLDKLAYSIANFAAAVDLSVSSIYYAIEDGELTPVYRGRKPLITREEGQRWLESLPAEPTKRSA
jgi:hypothetical protein